MNICTKTQRQRLSGNISFVIDDVLIHILSRLPIKSLFRFKCVSKAWKSLISHPSHGVIQPTTMSSLFYTNRVYYHSNYKSIISPEQFQYTFIIDKKRLNYRTACAIDFGDLSFFPYHRKFHTIDCCNGMLLGLTRQSGIDSTPFYYVINPATKKWAVVPEPPNEHKCYTTCMLAFDPSFSPYYTLIYSGLFPGVDIFSSKARMWLHSKVPQKLVTKPWRRSPGPQAVLFNHTLHMLSEGDSIVGFDVDRECFRLIPLPVPRPRNITQTTCIGVSGGYLYYANHDGFRLQIWTLKDYDDLKWILKHETTIDSLVENHVEATCSSAIYSHLPLCLHKKYLNDEHILADGIVVKAKIPLRHYCLSQFSVLSFHPDLEVVFLGMGGTMLSYHLDSKKLEEVWVSKLQHSRFHMGNVYPFSPCFADFY